MAQIMPSHLHHDFNLLEVQSPLGKFMSQLNLSSLLLLELEVLISSIPEALEFSDCSDWDKFIMVHSLELTRPPPTSSEELNLTLHSGIKFNLYSYPSRETIRKLVLKRGYGKINHQRIPLTNNRLVESTLAKHNITSVEDLIN